MISIVLASSMPDMLGQYVSPVTITWIAFAGIAIYLFYKMVLVPWGFG